LNINTHFIRSWFTTHLRSERDLYAYVCLRKNYGSRSGYVDVQLFSGSAGYNPGSSLLYADLKKMVKYGLATKVKSGVWHFHSHYRLDPTNRFVQIPDSAFESLDNFKAFLYALGGRMWLSVLNYQQFKSNLDLKDKAPHKRDVCKPGHLKECEYALSLAAKFTGTEEKSKCRKTTWKFRNLAWKLGYASGEKTLSFLTDDRDNFLHWLQHHPEQARLIEMKDGAAWTISGYQQSFNVILKLIRKKVRSGSAICPNSILC